LDVGSLGSENFSQAHHWGPRGGGHRSIEVKAEAMAEHNRALQSRLDGSVWSLCRSWYRMDNGKIVALFPGFTAEYVKAVQQPEFGHYCLA
jgi:hypothetical protein